MIEVGRLVVSAAIYPLDIGEDLLDRPSPLRIQLISVLWMKLIMYRIASCVGFMAYIMGPAMSLVNTRKPRISYGVQNSRNFVLPSWAEIGPIMAQLTFTPAAIYYIKNQMQEEVIVLDRKVQDLEQSIANSTSDYQEKQNEIAGDFSKDMRTAVTAYQKLYGGTSAKVTSVIMNESNRAAFRDEIESSIMKLQDVAGLISELKKGGNSLRSDVENSIQFMRDTTDMLLNQQKLQGKITLYLLLRLIESGLHSSNIS